MSSNNLHRKQYLLAFMALLIVSVVVGWHFIYHVPVRQAGPVLAMIDEGTEENMLKVERYLDGRDVVSGRPVARNMHQPLTGVAAHAVKHALLDLSERTDDQIVIMRVLSIFALIPSKRSGIKLETDEEWQAVERVANEWSERQKAASPSAHRFFEVQRDGDGNKVLAFGSIRL